MTGALGYVQRGIPVHPVDPTTKRPLTSRGVRDATTDVSTIERWAARWPAAGVAVATGQRSGIVVIDVDPRNGGEGGIADATGRLGNLPQTATVATPAGGWHYWFRLPAACDVRNSASAIAPGVDVRGDGGYVVAPPSRRSSGSGWVWATRSQLAVLPERWIQALTSSARRSREPRDTWLRMLEHGISAGSRNSSLTRLVGHLLAHEIDPHVVAALVGAVNTARCEPPLHRAEVDGIVESIAGRELRKRRCGR